MEKQAQQETSESRAARLTTRTRQAEARLDHLTRKYDELANLVVGWEDTDQFLALTGFATAMQSEQSIIDSNRQTMEIISRVR